MRLRLPAIENYTQRVQVDAKHPAVPVFKRCVLLQEIDVLDRVLQAPAFALPSPARHGLAQFAQILYRRVEVVALLLIQLVAMYKISEIPIGSSHSITNLFAQLL